MKLTQTINHPLLLNKTGKCIGLLPSPPTTSPSSSVTNQNGDFTVDFFYPVYGVAWGESGCSNSSPLPYRSKNDRPSYATHLACCKGAYGGQMSGNCLSEMETPPTTSPTSSDFETDFYYPIYEVSWTDSGCSNKLPLPFKNKADRPNYATHLACCTGAYGGQMSGKCLSEMENPPTSSPTDSGGWGKWIPDRNTDYQIATCLSTKPDPYLVGAYTEYDSLLECCKGAYANQASGACLSELPSPPTDSPIDSAGVGGSGLFYPMWTGDRTCSVDGNENGGSSSTQMECCNSHYSGETTCMCDADPCASCECTGAGSWTTAPGACPDHTCNPPTRSPTRKPTA